MKPLVAYTRQRLTAARLAPPLLLVVLAALAGGGWNGGPALANDTVIALVLVIAFRIWDDLADRGRDRTRHPDRVIVGAASLAPFRAAAGAAAVAGGALLGAAHGMASVVLLALYTSLLATSYAVRGPRGAAHDRILLLKYGVFALALIEPGAAGLRGLLASAAAFTLACVYEWWHDPGSPVFSAGGAR